jgi:hypothetical protein
MVREAPTPFIDARWQVSGPAHHSTETALRASSH